VSTINKKDTARYYSCMRCRSFNVICGRCDRGNRYCATCAPKASLDAKRRASIRYQNSPKGRLAHANRQKRYLSKIRNKVTHKGSSVTSPSDLILPPKKHTTNIPPKVRKQTRLQGNLLFLLR